MSQPTLSAIDAYADAHKITRHEAVERLIEAGVDTARAALRPGRSAALSRPDGATEFRVLVAPDDHEWRALFTRWVVAFDVIHSDIPSPTRTVH